MKRGPNRSADFENTKRQKSHSSQEFENSNPLELPELRQTILNFVPRYRLLGENKISAVCKQWYQPLKKEYFDNPALFSSILNECLKSSEALQFVLNDKILLSSINLKQVLEICSCQAEFAIHLLNTKVFTSTATGDLLISLARNHEKVALHLLEMTSLHYKLTSDHLVELSVKCPAFSACFVALACFDPHTNRRQFYNDVEIYGLHAGYLHVMNASALIEWIADEFLKWNETPSKNKADNKLCM